MKFINLQTVKKVTVISNIVLAIVLVELFFYFIKIRPVSGYMHPLRVLPITFLVYLVLIYLGQQYFEFDSKSEVLIVKNRSVLFFSILKEEKSVDFPKEKLITYKIKKGILKKTLYLIIKSKKAKTGQIKIDFNLTYVPSKKINEIDQILKEIVANNKQLLV